MHLEELRRFAHHLQSAREEEKARLAREIHDHLGQELTGLKIDLLWLDKQINREDPLERGPLHRKVQSMLLILDAMVQSVREISSQLRPAVLDQLGLSAAVEWQSQEFQKRSGISCRLRLAIPEDIILEKERATALFRIFQEILTNVIRHAEATCVDVDLYQDKNFIFLKVSDDGKGILTQKISDPNSLGLLGIRERVFLLEGEVSIQGELGLGTKILVKIPLKGQGHDPSADRG